MKYKSLSDATVKNAKDRKYILDQTSGGKSWRFDFGYYGKRKTMSLGVYSVVKLAKARKLYGKARELVAVSQIILNNDFVL